LIIPDTAKEKPQRGEVVATGKGRILEDGKVLPLEVKVGDNILVEDKGYSIALLEACASSLPIVTTDVGGNAEIVRDHVNGCIVPARDPDAMAAAMIELLADPARAQAMGRDGRDWVVEQGTVSRMAGRYDALYAGKRPD